MSIKLKTTVFCYSISRSLSVSCSKPFGKLTSIEVAGWSLGLLLLELGCRLSRKKTLLGPSYKYYILQDLFEVGARSTNGSAEEKSKRSYTAIVPNIVRRLVQCCGLSSLFFDMFTVHMEKVCGISTFMRKQTKKPLFSVCVFFNKSFEKLFNL